MDLRRALPSRFGRIDHGWQNLVVDEHFFGRILGLRQRLGDHDRDRIAHVAGLADGERRVRRHLHRRAIFRQHGPTANQATELALGETPPR